MLYYDPTTNLVQVRQINLKKMKLNSSSCVSDGSGTRTELGSGTRTELGWKIFILFVRITLWKVNMFYCYTWRFFAHYYLDKKDANLESGSGPVLLAAHPSYDMWALGAVLYQMCTGILHLHIKNAIRLVIRGNEDALNSPYLLCVYNVFRNVFLLLSRCLPISWKWYG